MASSKALDIMKYCEMKNSTPLAVEYFKRAKHPHGRKIKPIIKRRMYEQHYFKDAVYVNPNINEMINKIDKINKNTARKIRDFIDGLTM